MGGVSLIKLSPTLEEAKIMTMEVGWNNSNWKLAGITATGSRPEQKTSKYHQLASKGRKPLEGIPKTMLTYIK